MSTGAISLSWREKFIARYYRRREHPGRLRIIGWCRRLLGVDRLRVALAPDIVMELDEQDYVQREILLKGAYESGTVALFQRLLGETTHFCDVGAHVGQYTLLAARALANRGGVWAFEPTPINAAQLTRNARLSGLGNIHLFSCAIGDAPDFACMVTPSDQSTGNYHLATTGTAGALTLHAAVTPFAALKAYLPTSGFEVVKVDVEGHEGSVLASLFASGLPKPRHLIVEYNPRVFDYGVPGGLVAWLDAQGYAVQTIEGIAYSGGDMLLPEDNLWATLRH